LVGRGGDLADVVELRLYIVASATTR